MDSVIDPDMSSLINLSMDPVMDLGRDPVMDPGMYESSHCSRNEAWYGSCHRF